MVFAMLGQTESSGECEQTLERPQQTLAPNPSQRYRLRLLRRRRGALCVRLSGYDFQFARRRHRSMRAALCDGRVYRRRCRSSAAHIGHYLWLSRHSRSAMKNVFFEASSARRSKPIAAARRVGFSFRLAASAGTGSVVEALEEQGVHKLLRILQPLTGGNHETGSTRDLSYRACTWRLPPGIAGISADEARIDSSAFCSAIMSLS